jgi:ethanolamine ammonia-lyase small subunit
MADSDPWMRFRQTTRARIGLGRAGDAMPTRALLEFQSAHARARDAVHAPVDFMAVERAIAPLPVLHLHSAALDRVTYLRRPDLGRRLGEESRERLRIAASDSVWDLVFVVADGLSAAAVMTHAAPVLSACLDRLPGWCVAPIVCVEQARVAIGDEIGQIMNAKLCAVLIGERPGLSVADSLGIYLTWAPRIGSRDSERNCISNIHADGLSYPRAGDTAAWLIKEATIRRLTGLKLKEATEGDLIEAIRSLPSSSE